MTFDCESEGWWCDDAGAFESSCSGSTAAYGTGAFDGCCESVKPSVVYAAGSGWRTGLVDKTRA